ncbi:MAG: D-alanyl-D-alanine carboxypeptidase family protein [Candidatus Gracilibacteria bacterium]|jgi:LAS superfamily LD-carboxypeptidase LdcB
MSLLESISKSFGLESLVNVVPSLKKAYDVAFKNNDKGFLEKIGMFLKTYNEEKDKLDGDKEQISSETTEKVKEVIAEAPNDAPADDSAPSPDSVVESDLEIDPDEPFVRGEDHFGNTVILRESAMKAFEKAMEVAEETGVKLKVSSSYRSFEAQRKLYEHGVQVHGEEDVSTWVAEPGKSNHHTGGTIDVVAMTMDGNGKWVGGLWHKNQKLLKEILPRIGFVNYKPEPWHWEIYTNKWRKEHGIAGQSVYKKQRSLNA